MLKNRILFGIILSIILLIFSVPGLTAYYKYTQESGANFYVGTGDKADALEDTNEMRQIIDDLGALVVHSKRNDLYPKDGTTGGTLAIPNSALVSFATGTKGDLFYCSATNIWTKLNIGTDNQILVVATDLPNWETPSSDLLSDVASIAMLDENEDITGAWTISTGSIAGVDTTEFSYLDGVTSDIQTQFGLRYLKTEIDTQGELETIWGVTLATDSELAALKFTDLDDTPAGYDNGKYAKSTVDGLVWDTPPGGYTNLTSFIDQTAWRVFYSNNLGDVTELALGTDGQYLKSTGATSAPIFDTPTGAGDMLKATYDSDEDGDIDVAAGGTEKSSWTLYAIPYLSGTTAFGEIPIGTAEYALTVNAGANGYDWTELSFLANVVEDTTPQLGGQLQSGAHSINFTEQVLTSGTAIAWDLGNSNKATLTAAHNFTITITAPSGALNAQLIVTQDGTGSRVMDEIVTQKDEAIATTDVHTDTEIIDLTIDIPTGARIRFKTSAADLPDPLVVDTIYWAIRSSENHIKAATTKANAIAGTAVDLTDTGTGTHTVQQLVKWPAGTLGVLSTAAGLEDILSLTYKTGDKQWYAQLAKDFQ